VPKCTICQGVARTWDLLEYWHIGETNTRFGMVSPLIVIGLKSWLIAWTPGYFQMNITD